MISVTSSPEVFARLADVVRDEFGCPDLDVTPATSALDVDGWTSITHTMLLMRVETAFGIRLPIEQAASVSNLGELAELVRKLVPNGRGDQDAPGETASPGNAIAERTRWVIVHGNCQLMFASQLIAEVLRNRGYSFSYVPSFRQPGIANEAAPDQIANCVAFIEQVSPYDWGIPIKPTYAQHLPPGCRRLRVPALALKAVWPLAVTDPKKDPRNEPTAEFPVGKHPYGDSLVQRLVREHSDPETVFRLYMDTDLRKIVDLDRLHEIAMAEMMAGDKLADVPFASLIDQNFRTRRLFDTANHPSHELTGLLAEVLLSFVFEDNEPLPLMIPARQNMQIPIHPQVIEHFKLEWVTPSTRYLFRDDVRPVAFDQWLRMYINWQ